MSTEDNNQAAPVAGTSGGEGQALDKFEIAKAEYEELMRDRAALGSLKREFKDLKKSLESKDTPEKTTQPEHSDLIQKTFLRAAGITSQDEVELALTTARKWDMPVDKLVDDEDFKSKLEKHRSSKANIDATSNIRGDKGKVSAKDTPDYWLAKGVPPTAAEIPDRKARAKITKAFMDSARSSKMFYND